MQALVERDAHFRTWLEAHSQDDVEEEIAPMRAWDTAARRAALRDLLRLADRIREAQPQAYEAQSQLDGPESRASWYALTDSLRAHG